MWKLFELSVTLRLIGPAACDKAGRHSRVTVSNSMLPERIGNSLVMDISNHRRPPAAIDYLLLYNGPAVMEL
jgi:hypothetical protein